MQQQQTASRQACKQAGRQGHTQADISNTTAVLHCCSNQLLLIGDIQLLGCMWQRHSVCVCVCESCELSTSLSCFVCARAGKALFKPCHRPLRVVFLLLPCVSPAQNATAVSALPDAPPSSHTAAGMAGCVAMCVLRADVCCMSCTTVSFLAGAGGSER